MTAPLADARLGIVGCGVMGSAIVRGVAGREDLVIYGFDVTAPLVETLVKECGLKPAASLRALALEADYLLIAVKPHQVHGVLAELAPRLKTEQAVISIAAGLSLEKLKIWSSGVCPVVRVMPNTPAMVRSGVFALCLDDPSLKDRQKSFVQELFSPLGKAYVLPESQFDAFTGLIGSGPAYVFYFMEAMIEAGVTMGLTRPMATEMVLGLFKGSVELAGQSDKRLNELREMVTSPGGTTAAGGDHPPLGR